MKSHPTGNQWPVIWALLLCSVQPLVPRLLLLVEFEIESSGPVFGLNYLKSSGRKKLQHTQLLLSVMSLAENGGEMKSVSSHF